MVHAAKRMTGRHGGKTGGADLVIEISFETDEFVQQIVPEQMFDMSMSIIVFL